MTRAAMQVASMLWGRRSALLSINCDNIIFRHEIGMDSFGRLRMSSPILAAHLTMLAVLAVVGLMGLLQGWPGVFRASGWALLVMSLATYPVAWRRGFQAIARERTSGALEQLYMTSLTPGELFEGKFYGTLAPSIETRRYVGVLCFLLGLSSWLTGQAPGWLLDVLLGLLALNHIGYSAHLGVLAGLRAGCRGTRPDYGLLGDWDLNPWPYHLLLLARYSAILFIPVGILLWLDEPAAYMGFVLLLVMPYCAAIQLRDRECEERERLARNFRRIFSFEPEIGGD
jgi:hypothetical protein